jgi:plastocyanin
MSLRLSLRRRIEKMFTRVTSVLMLAVCFTACGGYSSPSSPSTGPTPAPAGSTTVGIVGGASTQTTTAFGQDPLTITAGTTISWLNNDTVTHTSSADGNQWSSGNIAPGGRFNFTFASAGRFTYHCQIHPNMVGTIVVQ